MHRTMSANIVSSCKVFAVIQFLCTKDTSAAKIYRELCLNYGPTVMSEGKIDSDVQTLKLTKQMCMVKNKVTVKDYVEK